ncbi:MAG: radical SAM protein [Ruminococcus sp.]|nr:radical SAM protein [Ruminococcus sp.]
MKHSNISIFIPHAGCPHRCSFCDQRTISGTQRLPHGDDVRAVCRRALSEVSHPENAEIAFFGGSFTAIPREYMQELLDAAKEFVGAGMFRGIRCSTRPDCIDAEVLGILAESGVTAIELGAQSMSDKVLEMNERGHTAADVENASRLIREYGFELGLQMMTGLYMSSLRDEMETARRIIEIKPDTVRIYPVVVLKGTRLGELCEQGEYELMPFEEMVRFCAELIRCFTDSGISVIKCGLHASEFVEADMVGGYYHPAFRELCEMHIYRRRIEELCMGLSGDVTIEVNDRCISRAVGQKRANTTYFMEKGINLIIVGNSEIPIYGCKLRR